MNFIFLIVIIYSLGMARTKDADRAVYKGYKLLSLRDGMHQIHDKRGVGSTYNELLQIYPHRERAKNFVFHSQLQNKARDVEDHDRAEDNTASGTWDKSVLVTSAVASPKHSDLRKPKVVLYSRKSWINDYLNLNAEDFVKSAQSRHFNNEVEIDVDLLIEYLITQGFSEEELRFLKTNLDYGFDEIERELRKIKDNPNKNKHISIGGEEGNEGHDDNGNDDNGNDDKEHDDNPSKSNSNSLKTSLKVLCLTFIFVVYII